MFKLLKEFFFTKAKKGTEEKRPIPSPEPVEEIAPAEPTDEEFDSLFEQESCETHQVDIVIPVPIPEANVEASPEIRSSPNRPVRLTPLPSRPKITGLEDESEAPVVPSANAPERKPAPAIPPSIKEAAFMRAKASFIGRFFVEKKLIKATGITTRQRIKRYDAMHNSETNADTTTVSGKVVEKKTDGRQASPPLGS